MASALRYEVGAIRSRCRRRPQIRPHDAGHALGDDLVELLERVHEILHSALMHGADPADRRPTSTVTGDSDGCKRYGGVHATAHHEF